VLCILQFQTTTREVYQFICSYIDNHTGRSPTIREIAQGVYVGHSTVMRHLDRLEAQGYIEREPQQARSIRPTAKAWPEQEA
jgi:DNA-binding MarR family transcriptional regulator